MVELLKIAPAFSISHDGLTAQGIMVFIRYMLLTVSKLDNEDERRMGE